MGVRKLQNTPWHAEQVHRAEGDDRRYKGRCKYYSYNGESCSKRNGRCIGSAHCMEYDALSDEEFKAKQAKQRKPSRSNGDDECYWY